MLTLERKKRREEREKVEGEEGLMMKENGRKQGAASPCAACKLLRRRCAQDCVFAPYFPADEPQKFANVHKVFGASNVNKMLQVGLFPFFFSFFLSESNSFIWVLILTPAYIFMFLLSL